MFSGLGWEQLDNDRSYQQTFGARKSTKCILLAMVNFGIGFYRKPLSNNKQLNNHVAYLTSRETDNRTSVRRVRSQQLVVDLQLAVRGWLLVTWSSTDEQSISILLVAS